MADINHFHQAGGMAYVISELLDGGLLHDDVNTILGPGLSRFTASPAINGDSVSWQPGKSATGERIVAAAAFVGANAAVCALGACTLLLLRMLGAHGRVEEPRRRCFSRGRGRADDPEKVECAPDGEGLPPCVRGVCDSVCV